MSWRATIADPVFRAYAAIVFGLLAVSGVILLVLSRGLKKDVAKVWTIWRSWVVMIPVAFLVVALGREAIIVGVTLLGIVGFKEFARATGLYGDWWMTGAVYLLIAAAGVTVGWPGGVKYFEAMPVYAVVAVFVAPILRNRVEGQLQAVALSVLGFLLLGWLFLHLALLTNVVRPYGYIAFVLFAVEVCDVAAYTSGKLAGRIPLRSAVSPRKTVAGSLGHFAVAMALPWVLGFSLPALGAWQKVLAGVIVGIGGQVGDLAISLIKRDLGIKDMGATIPGHGGVLDRIDSLIFVAPLFSRLVISVEPLR
jgi:phosphatidate cytidylyltransferase